MPLEPNIRLGQTYDRVRNNQEERFAHIRSLLGQTIIHDEHIPRNRQERRAIRDYSRVDARTFEVSTRIYNHQRLSLRGGQSNNLIWNGNLLDECVVFDRFWEQMFESISSFSLENVNPHIHSYRYKPKMFHFHKLDNDNLNLFFGLELELDDGGENDENAQYIQEYLGEDNCYVVHDGSLSDGLEIVTHPCSLEYHKTLDYDGLFKELSKRGYKDSDRTGFHVHVNRDYFNNDSSTIAKIIYLCQHNWDIMEKISLRKENEYSHRYSGSYLKDMFLKKDYGHIEELISGGYFKREKYLFLNLQHPHTIEFRMFKGTMSQSRINEVLKIVKTIVDVCHNNSYDYITNLSKVEFEQMIRF